MEFSDFELKLLLILVECKIKDFEMLLCDLEVNRNSIDSTEYFKLYRSNLNALESTQLLKDKIEKILEE